MRNDINLEEIVSKLDKETPRMQNVDSESELERATRLWKDELFERSRQVTENQKLREEIQTLEDALDKKEIRIQKLDAEANKLVKLANEWRRKAIDLQNDNVPDLDSAMASIKESHEKELKPIQNQLLQHVDLLKGEVAKVIMLTKSLEAEKTLTSGLQTRLNEVEETKESEITELKDLLDKERAKIDLYNDLKIMVPELKRCLLANSANQDTKEVSEKSPSSAMTEEQKESKVIATKEDIKHTESNIIPESIIPDSEENAIELDDTRATQEQSKSRSKATTAPEKITNLEAIKSSSKIKPFKITDRMGRILKFLKNNPGSYNAEISKGINISTGDVSKLLKALTTEGLTVRNEDGQYDLGKQEP